MGHKPREKPTDRRQRQPPLVSRLRPFGTTIFTEMTQLANRYGAINLGQGYPDFDGPIQLKRIASQTILTGNNQYTRSFGIAPLNRAIAAHHERFYHLEYDPETEITVANGASEILAATLLALVDRNDEVIVFEPFYDQYLANIAMAGGNPVAVRLPDPPCDIPLAALARAITPKTRVLILNSPHNPTGKVWRRDELDAVARLCIDNDLIAITDEVYEHLVYTGEHIPLASLPGMQGRTVMISSTAKTFAMTGWKIGYACTSALLTHAIRTTRQYLSFCSGEPFQQAMAHALLMPDNYFTTLHNDYARRRAILVQGLRASGLTVPEPDGAFYACADIRSLGFNDDRAFCHRLAAEAGVAAIPLSPFYLRDPETHWVRFAFCKTEEALLAAIDRLQRRLPQIAAP